MPNVNDVFGILASLIGFPALLAVLINVAKTIKLPNGEYLLPDGYAPKVVLYANLLALVGVGVALFTGNLPTLYAIDLQLGYAGSFVLTLAAFISQLGLAKGYNAILRGLPLVGKSYSMEKKELAKEALKTVIKSKK
jgi:hypothetical protein